MALYQIPILKGKGTVQIDSDKVDQAYYAYCLQLGMKAVVNRMAKIKKEDFDNDAEFNKAAMEKAQELVECLYSGKGIRMVGFKAGPKVAGKEKVEARRIAREIVKEQIVAAGEKLKDYSAADITAAADALIEANPSIMEEAKANLAARAEKASKIKVDVASIAKTGAKKGKEKAPLSALQAGKTAPRASVTAH